MPRSRSSHRTLPLSQAPQAGLRALAPWGLRENLPIPEANRRTLLDVIVNHGVYPLLT